MYHPDDCAAFGLKFHPVAAGHFQGRGDKRDWRLCPQHFVISMIDHGTVLERFAWGEIEGHAGEIETLWPGRWHEVTEQGGQPLATWWIDFDGPRLAAVSATLARAFATSERQPLSRPSDVPLARRLFSELVVGVNAAEVLPPAHFYARFFAIIDLCSGQRWQPPTRSMPTLIERAEALWQHEPYDALNPQALAVRLGVHPNTLLAAARAERGQTTARLVQGWKIERARRLLEHAADDHGDSIPPARKLTAIAAASGFASVSHFIRTFRAATGLNPGTYRHERNGRRQ